MQAASIAELERLRAQNAALKARREAYLAAKVASPACETGARVPVPSPPPGTEHTATRSVASAVSTPVVRGRVQRMPSVPPQYTQATTSMLEAQADVRFELKRLSATVRTVTLF
jgi:hypothetical protein